MASSAVAMRVGAPVRGIRHGSTAPPAGLGAGLSSWRRLEGRHGGRISGGEGGGRPETKAAAVEGLADAITSVAVHLPLAYEPVALPCSMMSCGDVVHRSTLDLVLRGEKIGPDWRAFLLLATAAAYLFAPPGVLPGAFDYYVLAKLRGRGVYAKDDVKLGRKLATGGFGTVFRGEMRIDEGGEMVPVIVKKAKEFGQAEAWMNERMMRLPGKHVAEFITAFDETLTMRMPAAGSGAKLGAPMSDAVWLVWRYEGDNNLMDLMESKEFPYNLEPILLDRELRLPKGLQRKAVTIRLVFMQLLQALEAAHSTGIVHRDVKPQNCIVSERDNKIKLIDLGAAADLRVGINYAPSEYLLDPRYAPPQQYVMSTQTPTPPPAPVAAFLSPVLWRMESPDRFDMWSCGVTLIQMVFPSLRSDNAICAFNERLQTLRYDLRAWRAEEEGKRGGLKPDMAEGFALLDMDDGAGWELLCNLMAYKPSDRCSASEALLSPFFRGSGITSPSAAAALLPSLLSSASKATSKLLSSEALSGLASSATGEDRGSLTEAQLRQELGLEEAAPQAPRRASSTIAWWQERQSQLRKSIEKREGSQGSSGGLPVKGGGKAGGGKAGAAAGSKGKTAQPPPPLPPPKNGLAALLGGLTAGGRPGNNNGAGQQGAAKNGGGNGRGGERRRGGTSDDRAVELVGARKGFDLMGILRNGGNGSDADDDNGRK